MKRITLSLPAPYVGLRPFEEKDALLFFGREAHVHDLLSKLEHYQRFIAVIGASGSGKSSLVRAGLIPALHRGALVSAGHRWQVYITQPGDAPLQHLVEKLTDDERWVDGGDRTASMASLRAQFAINPLALVEQYQQRSKLFNGKALLLVIDQFEEIFRYRQQNIDEAEAFVKLLLRSVSESESVPIYVVITLRSDFLGNCVAFFGLPEAINSGLYLTPRLRAEQLKSIITSPLALIGSNIDPILVNRLINTLAGDDELPILEHALLRMWNYAKENSQNRIEAQDFAMICKPPAAEESAALPKLAFAIDNHASAIYNQLTPQQQAIVQQIFPVLVERRENRDVRRPQTLQQLVNLVGQHEQDQLMNVIEAYRQEGAGYLLPPEKEPITTETLIDISHESFFRQWRLYQQWLDEEAHDVTELKEWHYRLEQQQADGGWLDDSDSHRASQWLIRIHKYHNPQQWLVCYLDQGDFQSIKTFIETSQQRSQEKQQAETKRLEAEAAWQRQLAEAAQKQQQQAEAFAKASRIKSYWALSAAVVAILLAVAVGLLWDHAEHERIRADREKDRATQAKRHAEKLARNAHLSALIATAENRGLVTSDQSILLGLAAWKIERNEKVVGHLRSNFTKYTFQHSLRGVKGARFSPDGKTILTWGEDNTARLWDGTSSKLLQELQGHEGAIEGAQFSFDSKTILSWSKDKTVRLWDVASGKPLQLLQGHQGHFLGAQFSPDGKTILTWGDNKTARLWNGVSGKLLQELQGHEGVIGGAQFSPDGKTILTRSDDDTVRLWDGASGKLLQVLQDHEGFLLGAQFSPDGKIILTYYSDVYLPSHAETWKEHNKVRLWDGVSGKPLQVLQWRAGRVKGARFSPDSKLILIYDEEFAGRFEMAFNWGKGKVTARLWDVASGKSLQVLQGQEELVYDMQFSPDGKMILTWGGDKTARLWNVASGKSLQVLQGHEGLLLGAQFSPDGEMILTWSEDNTARLWNAASGTLLQVLQGHEAHIVGSQFSPDSKTILTRSADKTVLLWDALIEKPLQVLQDHEESIYGAQFSPDGKTILTYTGVFLNDYDSFSIQSNSDKAVRLWDAVNGEPLQVLQGHEESVYGAQFSPDSKMILSWSGDRTVRLWDVVSGKPLQVLQGHEGPPLGAQFSPDGKIILTYYSGSNLSGDAETWKEHNKVRLWDGVSGKLLQVLQGHEEKVLGAQFSPDGKMVLTWSTDNTLRLWDGVSGKQLQGHKMAVRGAQFSPDGKTILTYSGFLLEDQMVQLWDVASGKPLQVLRGHEANAKGAQFSPDGKTFLTYGGNIYSEDKIVRVMDVASGKLLQVLQGHEGAIEGAQFSFDSKTILSWSKDKTVRLWDVASGKPLQLLQGHQGHFLGAQFSPDSKTILTRSEDGTAQIWPCDVCRPIEEIAAALQRRVGRELTEEERHRFGLLEMDSLVSE